MASTKLIPQLGLGATSLLVSGALVFSSSLVANAASSTPKIKTQPASTISYNGQAVSFSVKATGSKLKYSWHMKATSESKSFKITSKYSKVKGESTSKITVTPTSYYKNAQFWVVVTSGSKSVTSKKAKLTAKTVTATKITTQPKSVKAKLKKTVSMSVKAKGSGLHYRWQIKLSGASKYENVGKSYTRVTGEYTSKVKIKNLSKTYNKARLRAVVTGHAGKKTSKSSLVTVTNSSTSSSSTSTASLTSATYGVDFSKYQSPFTDNISYSGLVKNNFGFLIAKLGTSEKCAKQNSATQKMDATYTTHIKNARNNGLAVGHYWFNGAGKPSTDAKYFVKHLSQYKSGDPLVLDVEAHYVKVKVKDEYVCKQVDNWTPDMVNSWVNTVKKLKPGSNVYIYMAQGTLSRANWSTVASKTRLWIARFGTNNGSKNSSYAPKIKYWSTWSIWQYTSRKTTSAVKTKAGKKKYIDANYAKADAWTAL